MTQLYAPRDTRRFQLLDSDWDTPVDLTSLGFTHQAPAESDDWPEWPTLPVIDEKPFRRQPTRRSTRH